MTRSCALFVRGILAAVPLALSVAPPVAGAAPIDPRFGDGGIRMIDPESTGSAEAIAVQSKHRIVAAGSTERLGGIVVGLTRWGQVDRLFANGGIARFPAADFRDLAIDDKGRIVALARGRVMRLNPDGSRDARFGGGGVAALPQGVVGRELALPDNEAIAIGGTVRARSRGVPGGTKFVVTRLLADGRLDPSFGAGGRAVNELGRTVLSRGLVAHRGRLVLAATGVTAGGASLAAFDSRGAADSDFGDDGLVKRSFGGHAMLAGILSSGGRYLIGGSRPVTGRGSDGFVLARLLLDGRMDRTFSKRGMTFVNAAGETGAACDRSGPCVRASAMVSDGRGRAVIGGDADMPDRNWTFARFKPDGSRDRNFAGNGVLVTGMRGRVRDLAASETTAILVAGDSGGGASRHFTVARLCEQPPEHHDRSPHP